jgi:phospholipase/carboxylesterase
MNRLFADATDSPVRPAPPSSLAAARVKVAVRSQEPHSFFVPQHYEPGYAYPLLVWLHSAEGSERQVQEVLPLISTRNFVGLGIRGTTAGSRRGHNWLQAPAGILAAEQRILDAVDLAAERFNIHDSRVYLAGYQAGGTMALRIALRNPERFAAGLSIAGSFPTAHAPLVRLNHLRKFPVFLAHGRDSQACPIDRVCQELRLLHAAGMGVTLRQYPCGDDLTTQMLADMNAWLMDHVTGQTCTEEADATPLQNDWN